MSISTSCVPIVNCSQLPRLLGDRSGASWCKGILDRLISSTLSLAFWKSKRLQKPELFAWSRYLNLVIKQKSAWLKISAAAAPGLFVHSWIGWSPKIHLKGRSLRNGTTLSRHCDTFSLQTQPSRSEAPESGQSFCHPSKAREVIKHDVLWVIY